MPYPDEQRRSRRGRVVYGGGDPIPPVNRVKWGVQTQGQQWSAVGRRGVSGDKWGVSIP